MTDFSNMDQLRPAAPQTLQELHNAVATLEPFATAIDYENVARLYPIRETGLQLAVECRVERGQDPHINLCFLDESNRPFAGCHVEPTASGIVRDAAAAISSHMETLIGESPADQASSASWLSDVRDTLRMYLSANEEFIGMSPEAYIARQRQMLTNPSPEDLYGRDLLMARVNYHMRSAPGGIAQATRYYLKERDLPNGHFIEASWTTGVDRLAALTGLSRAVINYRIPGGQSYALCPRDGRRPSLVVYDSVARSAFGDGTTINDLLRHVYESREVLDSRNVGADEPSEAGVLKLAALVRGAKEQLA